MSEIDGTIQSEIPGQLTREPQIGDIVKPISLTEVEWRTVFQKMGEVAEKAGDAPRGFSFYVGQESMAFETHGWEDQSMARDGSALVATQVLNSYSSDGLLKEIGVLREFGEIGVESGVPTSAREFTYDDNEDGTFTVVKIVDTLISGGQSVTVAVQTLEEGAPKQEQVHPFPKLPAILDTILDTPLPLSDASFSPGSIEVMKKLISEEPNPALRIEETDRELKISFSHLVFSPHLQTEFIETQTVRLTRNENGAWEKHYQSWDFLSPTGKEQTQLDSQEIEFGYNDGIYVSQKTSSKGQDWIFERYEPVRLPILNKRGKSTTKSVHMFDIIRQTRDINDPESLPLQQQPKEHISFIDYVLLKSNETGKRSNFGVGVEDQVVIRHGLRRSQRMNWKVIQDGRLVLNPQAQGATDIERTVHLPTGQTIRVNLKLDSTGEKIDKSQSIQGVTLVS